MLYLMLRYSSKYSIELLRVMIVIFLTIYRNFFEILRSINVKVLCWQEQLDVSFGERK